ncbi:MAG: isopentenyl-diphosphate delta-isomerase, partial [Pseudomonadota bacterium]
VGGGLVEHEVVDLFTAEGRPEPVPNPEEVMATRWVTLDALREEIAAVPERFTPWLRIYLADHAALIFGEVV